MTGCGVRHCLGVVQDGDARFCLEQRAKGAGREGLAGFDPDGLGVAVDDGHAGAHGRDAEVGEVEDFAGLVDEFEFLIRVALIARERACDGQDVEGDGLWVLAWLGVVVAGQDVGGLGTQRVDGGLARARDGLVRGNRDALEADGVAHRTQDGH